LIRILITFVGIYVAYRVFSWAIRSLGSKPAGEKLDRGLRSQDINEMVKDPVCGKYVLAWEARRTKLNGKNYYFCSDECQKRFLEKN
jgi:YHS domain-containing protein